MTAAELFTTIPAKPTPPPGVLRGPANADNFRVKVGRYGDRFYTDPLETDDIAEASDWVGPSVSVVKKAAGFGAAEYVVMDRMSQSDELATIAALPKEKRYGRLKNLNDEGRDEAFARGHGVHLAAEQILYGQPVTLREGQPGWDYLAALQSYFDTCQPTLVAAEVVCLHRDLNGKGYGGTTDAIVEIDNGIWGIDYKSRGKDHGAYPEEAAQIAAYLRAQYMLIEGEHGAERRPLPAVTGGLIISITRDSFEIHPIDVDAAFEHWTSLHAWWLAKQDERKTLLRKWAPRKIAAPAPAEPAPTGTGSLSSVPVDDHKNALDPAPARVEGKVGDERHIDTATSPAAFSDDRRTELRRRYNLLNEHDQAKFRGLFIDPNDLDLIETHLDGLDAFTNVHTEPPPVEPSKTSYKEGDKVTYKGKEYMVGTDNGYSVYLPKLPDHLATRSAHTKAGQWGYPEIYERWVPKKDVAPVQRPKVVPIPEPSLGVKVEGDPVTDAEWTATAQAFDQLDAAGKTFVKDIVAEAHAAQQWMSGIGNKTTRRHRLLTGLVTLAAAEMKGEL